MSQVRKMEDAPTDGTKILAYVRTKGSKLSGWTVIRKRKGWSWSTVPGDYGCEPLCWTPLPPEPTFTTTASGEGLS